MSFVLSDVKPASMHILKLLLLSIIVSSFQISAKESAMVEDKLTSYQQTRPFIQGVLTHTFIQPKHLSSYMLHLIQILFQNPSATKSWPPSFKQNPEYQLELLLGYQHPLSLHNGFATSEPQKHGIKDIALNVHYPFDNKVVGIIGVTYPLSSISRSTSLQVASTLGAAYQWHFKARAFKERYPWFQSDILLKVSSLITGFLYKYKSIDLFANPLIIGHPSIQLQTQFGNITGSVHLTLSGIYDHDKVLHSSQQLKVQTAYTLKNISFSLAYLWDNHSRNFYINLNQFLVFGTGFQAGLTWKV